ncbi:unnamed protein product [Auanema sp. JU1783]|nr:unnamed protein product [Auanema sp. JU1783]
MITLQDVGAYDFSKTPDENFGALSSPFYKDLDRILPLNDNSALENFSNEIAAADVTLLFQEKFELTLSEASGLKNVDIVKLFDSLYPEFLSEEMQKNMQDVKIKALTVLQKHMFVFCSLDRPFVLYSEMKSGRKAGYLIPLIEKVAQAREGRPTKHWEGPSMLIVTFTEQRARHIAALYEKLSRSLCVKSVNMLFGNENDLELTGGDIYTGKLEQIIKFLKINNVDASVIDYLVIEECNKALIPDYTKDLMRLHAYFSLHCGVPANTYLIYDKITKVQPVLEGFLNKNHNVIKYFRPTRVVPIKIHVVSFYERSSWLIFKKIRVLEKQLKSSEAMEYECKDSRWLILVPNNTLVHYLYGYLSLFLKFPPLALTSLTDKIGLEDITGKFRDKHNVLIAEYDVLDRVPESGYISNIVCFEVPRVKSLLTFCKIRYLARNVKGHLYIFFNPLIDMHYTGVVCKFIMQCHEPISQELYDLYQWVKNFKNVDRDRNAFPTSWSRLHATGSPTLPK